MVAALAGSAGPAGRGDLESIAAVVLAAGKGTRMRSSLPKVLHPLLDEPMISHTLRTLREAGIAPERTVVVVGHGAELVKAAVSHYGPYLTVEQIEQLGTGHALRMAAPLLEALAGQEPGAAEQILIIYGDGPLLRPVTLQRLFRQHFETQPLLSMLTADANDPTGYGRIPRDPRTGAFKAIIEENDLTLEQKALREWNPGIYLCQAKWLWPALSRLQKNPRKGEYFLTDIPGFAVEAQGGEMAQPVQTLPVEAEEVLGINDRRQLADASLILRRRILEKWMLQGVTVTDPATTYISAECILEEDCVIEPNTHLRGATRIGSGSVIGPNSLLIKAQIGRNCIVQASMVEESVMEDNTRMGPFSHLRPGAYLESGVKLGNFAEVVRSRLGSGTHQGHFSYIGDSTLGTNVNIGAGTITSNFDGKDKHKTIIGANVKLGSDTIIVAPVTIGDGAVTGSGAVITKDVAPGTTVVGVPAKPLRKETGLN